MADVSFDMHARTAALERLPQKLRDAWGSTRAAMHVWAIDIHGDFVSSHLSGSPVRRLTGQLERSFQPVWSESPASFKAGASFAPTMSGPAGTFTNYAYMLERGGTITPKGGHLLAWPVISGPAVTGAGIPRYAGPRSFPGKLFFHKDAKTGRMYLAQVIPGNRKGAGPGLQYVYHLAPQVTIRARMGFSPWAAQKRDEGRALVLETMKEGLAA